MANITAAETSQQAILALTNHTIDEKYLNSIKAQAQRDIVSDREAQSFFDTFISLALNNPNTFENVFLSADTLKNSYREVTFRTVLYICFMIEVGNRHLQPKTIENVLAKLAKYLEEHISNGEKPILFQFINVYRAAVPQLDKLPLR